MHLEFVGKVSNSMNLKAYIGNFVGSGIYAINWSLLCRDSFLNHDNEASTSYASSLWLYAIYISWRIRTKLCSMCKISLLLFNLVWRLMVCDNFFTFITSLENSSKCIGELLWYSIWALIYYDIWVSFFLFVCLLLLLLLLF